MRYSSPAPRATTSFRIISLWMFLLKNGHHSCRRVARIWKRGGGYFERVRTVQTTLTRIFIGLQSNLDEIHRKALKFNGFFRPKSDDLQKKKRKKKKRSSPKLRLIFRPNSEIQTFEGGCFSMGGGYFQFLTKNRPQKHQKRAILHTSQANGGARAPPPPSGYATAFLNCLWLSWLLQQDL